MASQAVVNVVVNAADADRELPRQITRIVNDAERRAPTVDIRVDLDTERLRRTIIQESDFQSEVLGRGFQRVTDSMDANFSRLADSLSEELRRITFQTSETSSAIARLDGRLEELGHTALQTGNDLDHAGDSVRRAGDDGDDANGRLGRLVGILGNVGRASAGLVTAGLRVVSLASVASTAVPVVAGLVTEITNMAPAAAIGVSALVTYAGAINTLKLATSGVGDAVSEIFKLDSDPKKVEEALKNLSPAAQSFVRELQKMKPAFSALRLDVQDRFFKGLNTTLTQTGKAVFPAVQRATRSFADNFNLMARRVGAGAQELAADGSLGKALDGSTRAFSRLRNVPSQVLEAIVRLAAGGAGPLDRISQKIASIATDITAKLEQGVASGGLERAIEGAVDTINQLGRVAGNVFGALGNIFGVADEKGGGLFATLEKITQALEDATATPEFQKTLSSLIDLGNTLVTTIMPLLMQAFQVIAPVIQTLVPPLQEFVRLLGDKLSELLPELGPPLNELALNIGLLLEALTPLIDEGINVLVESMPDLVRLFTSVAQVITELTPVIAFLAPFIGDVLVVAINILVGALAVVNSTLATVIDFTKRVATVLVDLATTLVEVVIKAIDLVAAVLSGDWSTAWNLAKSIVKDALGFAFRAVKNFADGVLDAISRLADLLPSGARRALNGLVTAAREKGSEAVQWIKRTGTNMINAVTGYAGQFYNAGKALISSFVRGIGSMVSAAADAAKRVVSAARDFLPFSPAKRGPLSGRGYPLYSGMAFTQSFARGITAAAPALDKAVGSLLGRSLTATGGGTLAMSQVSGGGSGLLTASTPRITTQVAAPVVNISIGNERLRNYMLSVVDDNDRRRDRLAAQGTGR